MPKAETVKEVNTALGQVVQAVADCTITPHEAQTMVSILEVPCRALKTADLGRVFALWSASSLEPDSRGD